jgi:hypothetical protein
MKTLKIYERTITERTGYKKFAFKVNKQISILYDNKEYKNHYENINNSKLRVKFNLVLGTRNRKEIENYYNQLGRTNVEKWLKNNIQNIMEAK